MTLEQLERGKKLDAQRDVFKKMRDKVYDIRDMLEEEGTDYTVVLARIEELNDQMADFAIALREEFEKL